MKNLLFSILITFFTITSHCSLRLPNLETFHYNAEGDLILTSQKELNPNIFEMIDRDLGVLKNLKHENIVKLIDVFSTSIHFYLIVNSNTHKK